MPTASQPVIGTIRIKTAASFRGDCDDSTLELLLEGLARGRFVADDVTATDARLPARRFSYSLASADAVVRANVNQLLDDLQHEFERLSALAP